MSTARVPGVRRRDLHPLLDPERWGELSDDRITLTPCGAGDLTVGGDESIDGDRTIGYVDYMETFRASAGLTLTPRLRFVRGHEDDERPGAPGWLEYRLADEQSAGEIVTVDQGSIVVQDTGDGVRVETTKRVRLTPPFDAPSLALQAEVLGYPDAFEQMVRAAVRVAAAQAA
jgi:hypothetical protein